MRKSRIAGSEKAITEPNYPTARSLHDAWCFSRPRQRAQKLFAYVSKKKSFVRIAQRAVGAFGGAFGGCLPGQQSLRSKRFFFEKKKQKAFVSAVARSPEKSPTGSKSFLVLFFKKEPLAFFY